MDDYFWLNGNASANLDINRNGILETGLSVSYFPRSYNDWEHLKYGGYGGTGIGDDLLAPRMHSGEQNLEPWEPCYSESEFLELARKKHRLLSEYNSVN